MWKIENLVIKWFFNRYCFVWKSIPLSLKIGHVFLSALIIFGILYDSIVYGKVLWQEVALQSVGLLVFSFIILETIFLFEFSAVNLFKYEDANKRNVDSLVGRMSIRVLLFIGIVSTAYSILINLK